MWPFWILFLLPAAAAALARAGVFAPGPNAGPSPHTAGLSAMGLLLVLLIGYRFQVGGDWGSYIGYVLNVKGLALPEVLAMGDPGYQLVNWLSVQAGWGIYGVNLISGWLLVWGLSRFCRALPNPWLAMALAVPYLVIVVGMGYSRQGVALGLSMLGLVALQSGTTWKFVAWVVVAATFHKTAVLLLPIAALAATRNRSWTAVWVGVVTLLAYQLLLEEAVEGLLTNYVDAEYDSQGALVRLLMNALPAALLLAYKRRLKMDGAADAVWRWFAIISLALLAVLFVSPSSTAVDRIGLYMLPLQLVVFARLPDAWRRDGGRSQGLVWAVLAYYATVQFVWLNFAVHAQYWLPYRSYPLEVLF